MLKGFLKINVIANIDICKKHEIKNHELVSDKL